jgi:hypothetical protein
LNARRRPLSLLLAGAALALSAGLLAPSAARADCSSHTFSLSRSDDPFAASHGGFTPEADPATHGPKPCSGPNCSSRRSPDPAPSPPPPPRAQEWGCALDHDPPPGPPPGGRLADDDPRRPVRRTAEVFHPPRLSPCSSSL